LKHALGLGKGHGTGLLGVAQVPEHATTDDRGGVHWRCETAAVFFISQDIRGEGQTTPGQHRDQTRVAEGADEAREGHGGEMNDHGAQRQTQPPVYGEPSIPSHLRAHLTIAQDAVRQDREDGLTRRALDASDGDPTQPDTRIMRMARQAPSPATRRLMCELQAHGEEKGEHTFDKRLPVGNQVKVGCGVSKVDGDSAVFSRRFRRCAHVLPLCHQVSEAEETQ
jgi:hypothetical protein